MASAAGLLPTQNLPLSRFINNLSLVANRGLLRQAGLQTFIEGVTLDYCHKNAAVFKHCQKYACFVFTIAALANCLYLSTLF
ncbi:MAG: hypothetical protein P8Y42_04260 [Exilibacterium sp.]